MFNNVALDVFIGLVFIFLLYSLLATIIQEAIATRLAFRAKVLEKAILRMLEDGRTDTPVRYLDRLQGLLHLLGLKNMLKGKKVAPWFYAHPLIKYLAEDNFYSKPAYLNSRNFSKVVLDLLKGMGKPESEALLAIHNSVFEGVIHKLPVNTSKEHVGKANPAIKALRDQDALSAHPAVMASETVPLSANTALFLRSLWQDSGADIEVFRQKIEQWYNDTMARATGWYKKYTRILLFIMGILIAYFFNVDAIAIHRILATNKTAREQLVQMAISQQKNMGAMIDSVNHAASASDSMLQNAYEDVSADVRSAGSILGLGKPWKDTCRLCKDSLNPSFHRRLSYLQARKKRVTDSVTLLKDTLARLLSQQKNQTAGMGPTPKQRIGDLKLRNEIARDSSLLVYYNGVKFPEYQRMRSLEERCAYIHSRRSKKMWLYSPLQRGGIETLAGWIITALAIMLGAPFWFDLLGKLISIRGAGKKISLDDTNDVIVPVASPAPSTTTSVNVNTNSGEEAVG
jgi:hypothetical protein